MTFNVKERKTTPTFYKIIRFQLPPTNPPPPNSLPWPHNQNWEYFYLRTTPETGFRLHVFYVRLHKKGQSHCLTDIQKWPTFNRNVNKCLNLILTTTRRWNLSSIRSLNFAPNNRFSRRPTWIGSLHSSNFDQISRTETDHLRSKHWKCSNFLSFTKNFKTEITERKKSTKT